MAASDPTSYYTALAQSHAKYEEGVRDGTILPFTYPMSTYGVAAVLVFLLIPPRSRFHNLFVRYVVFTVLCCWHVFMIRHCRAYNNAASFGIGIISAWGILWTAVLLIFDDGKTQFRRVLRQEYSKSRTSCHIRKMSKQKKARFDELEEHDNQRQKGETPVTSETGSSKTNRKSKNCSKGNNMEVEVSPVSATASTPDLSHDSTLVQALSAYVWQSYPITPFLARLDWICNLYTSFRGIEWNWKISDLPSLPPSVQAQLQTKPSGFSEEDSSVARNGVQRFDTYASCLRHNISLCLQGYLILDALITLSHHDPYFWGCISCKPPESFPPVVRDSWLLVRFYRLLGSISLIWIGLRTIFSFAPMFFVGFLRPWTALVDRITSQGGSRISRATHRLNQKAKDYTEPWLYPDQYGDYRVIFDRGLAGFWGSFWHQMFRYAFQAGGEHFVSFVPPLRRNPRSQPTKIVKLFIAFLLSGCLHACGSATQVGDTTPWTGPFLFFALQPIGMLIELLWQSRLRPSSKQNKPGPRWRLWLRRIINFCFVHAWLFCTGSLFADDIAKGGIWLSEPVMFSPLRALGLGVKGDSWLCWRKIDFMRWHSDGLGRWALSGLAF